MSNSRERILDRLRAGTAPDTAPPEIPVRAFDWAPQARVRRFAQQLAAVRGQLVEVGEDWPAALHGLLAQRGVETLTYGPEGPWGQALESGWPPGEAVLFPYAEPIDAIRGRLFDSVGAGFTSCRGGIAETGSVVLWPDAREPRLLSLVPPVHIVLLPADAIRSTLAELAAEQAWGERMPTNALLVTGPSRSADIEQTITYGVHGPGELIVLLMQDRRSAA